MVGGNAIEVYIYRYINTITFQSRNMNKSPTLTKGKKEDRRKIAVLSSPLENVIGRLYF